MSESSRYRLELGVGGRVGVVGPSGTTLLPGEFSPGELAADPYGGPGGPYWYEFELFAAEAEVDLIVTRVCSIFGEERASTCWASDDEGRSFRVRDAPREWLPRLASASLRPSA